jgi:hypothetical protein
MTRRSTLHTQARGERRQSASNLFPPVLWSVDIMVIFVRRNMHNYQRVAVGVAQGYCAPSYLTGRRDSDPIVVSFYLPLTTDDRVNDEIQSQCISPKPPAVAGNTGLRSHTTRDRC